MSKIIGLRWLWPAFMVVVGILGMATLWTVVSMTSQQPCAWLALVAAADIALLLRLSGAPGGHIRRILAVLGTLAAIAFSYWMIVASQMGQVMGMTPMASALRLGPSLAWDLTRMSFGRWDIPMLLVALPMAAWWAGGNVGKPDKLQ